MDENIIWKIIDSYFQNNEKGFVNHHLESYNDFFQNGIYQIFKEKAPITLTSNYDEKIGDFRNKCVMYMGGKDGSRLYFGKPVIYDDKNTHYMFPNEARLRNMTYGMTIHYDVEIEFINYINSNNPPDVFGGYNEDNEEQLIPGGGPKKDVLRTNNRPNERNVPRGKKLVIRPFELITDTTNETQNTGTNENIQRYSIFLEKILLGKFPIMLHSNFCILNNVPREIAYTMGECKNDIGGYFIIQGLEKTIIPQEKFANNMLWVRMGKPDEEFICSADIKSVSENVSKPMRNLSIQILKPNNKYSNLQIIVNVPNVQKPVPLFILFRALGIISDKKIIEMCLLDLNKYETMVDKFTPSVYDAGGILTQKMAIEYIAVFTKGKKTEHTLEILSDYLFPHIGETNYTEKAYYLGYMVFRLMSVYTGIEQPTDRDNLKYKRLELVGSLLSDLFREYYNLQLKHIQVKFEEKLLYNQNIYSNNLPKLITDFYNLIFKNRILEDGFKRAFKGNWGAQAHTKRLGIVQDLNRLSFNTYLSHLRKINLPMDATAKIVEPRKLHCSQWGFIDPIDTPDGANIGLHKTLAITTYITSFSGKGIREKLIEWLRENINMKCVEECDFITLSNLTKIIINGYWAGGILNPFECIQKIKLYRRIALLPIYMSICFNIQQNTIYIYTDAGRLCRPIFYYDEFTKKMSFEKPPILENLKNDNFVWKNLISGFIEKPTGFNENIPKIFELNELYSQEPEPMKNKNFINNKAIIDFIDCSESEGAYICNNLEEYTQTTSEASTGARRTFTHLEIHESLILGNMCNLICFPENNPPTRNSFSCGQSKQAVSLYHTNFNMRMDKTAVVLNTGQIPLVKTRYLKYINNEENPYGENTIIAIMCYSGYNVEDAVLINEGALKRGLFHTTYYTSYQLHEEINKKNEKITNIKFTDIQNDNTVVGTKMGYDYSKLDKYGLIKEGTPVDEKTVLIGLTTDTPNSSKKRDMSKTPKKGQLGFVDKSFMTEGEEGERIAKIRIREQRIPNLGDKMAARQGQKGTIGMVIPECDMPFTRDGVRPDLIINPHALPSRMTVGLLVECLMGKACVNVGGFGDCTAFVNRGSKVGVYGELLTHFGYHSSGNEILYNGMSGEQLEGEIFMGPSYYMRLKHMVKDKINYRSLGPRTAITRQPVSGRANDGGLRIGEMERDSVVSHGTVNFLTESMMERGDKFHIAICNTTGMMAIYNPAKNLFLSPMADGPIRFLEVPQEPGFHIENVSQFGRNFSIVQIPYSFKLLMQELQTINIQMRIITEDNIHQLEHMLFSKNVDKLMNENNGIQTVGKNIKNKINNQLQNTILQVAPLNVNEIQPDITPKFAIKQTVIPSTHPEFKQGDVVFYRGDPYLAYEEPREWMITTIGKDLAVIQTIENNPTQINAVKYDEIYLPGTVPNHLPTYFNTPSPPYTTIDTPPSPPYTTIDTPPEIVGGYPEQLSGSGGGIHFAPVINIVGGDNNGKMALPEVQGEGVVVGEQPKGQDITQNYNVLGGDPPKNTENIDFSKLVINKI